MHVHAMKTYAPRAQRLLACLGDPSRFRVVAALVEGDRCVTELAAAVGLSQSCTTRHLQALLRERMVRRTRDGKRVYFGISTEEELVRELIDLALRSAGSGVIPNPMDPRAFAPVSDSSHARFDPAPAERPDPPGESLPPATELDDYLL